MTLSGTWKRDGCADLRSGLPAVGGKAGPPLMQATGDVVVLFAAWAVTMFSSGVPAFNVELEGDSFHLQLSRAQLVHRVCQVPSSVHSAESSPPGNASLTWRPVKASRMDGALQHGPDGRRSSTIWSWAVEVRLLHGPAFGPVSRRSSTTSGAISLTNQRPPERPRQRRGWVPWWGCGSRPYGPSGCASAVTIVSAVVSAVLDVVPPPS